MSMRPGPIVSVRPANLDDSGRLLEWANDPVTREASFRPGMIAPAAHEGWLADRLASPGCRLMIGSEGSTPVGQIRFELTPEGSAEIGISVAPTARGRGIGAALLAAGLAAVRSDRTFPARMFVARVRVGNTPSLELFEQAGFTRRGTSHCEGIPCVVFELMP